MELTWTHIEIQKWSMVTSDLRLHNSLALASPLSGQSKLDYKSSIDNNNNSYHNAVHVHTMYISGTVERTLIPY